MAGLRAPTRRRRLLGAARQAAGLGVVVLLTVVLAQSTTTAAFSTATGDTGNGVGAAATFCSAPGTTSAGIPVRDASTNGTTGNANTVYNGTTNATGTSTGGDGYYYIRFDMPATVPSRCDVVSATLALYAGTAQPATMVVQRAAATWSDTTLTWNNQPALTGSPASLAVTGAGWHSYPVGDHVTAFLAGPATNFGFVIRDQLTLGGPISAYRYQIYNSFSNASNKPTLTITWG